MGVMARLHSGEAHKSLAICQPAVWVSISRCPGREKLRLRSAAIGYGQAVGNSQTTPLDTVVRYLR